MNVQISERRLIGGPCRAAVAVLAAGALLFSGPVHAEVEVNVTHVGFPGISPPADLYRYGTWVQVVVDLALIGQPSFDGFVQISQADGDGDAGVDSVEVHLRADSGGAQRVRLYTLPGPGGRDDPFPVELRSADGELVRMLSEGTPGFAARPVAETMAISHDHWLVLSVSNGAAGRVAELAASSPSFALPVAVAHVAPTDLPDLHIGLESVDSIIWDDARPEDLTTRQLAALLEWVRQGGVLVVAAGPSAGLLRLSGPLRDVLPAEIGDVVSVENLPEVRETILGEPPQDAERDQVERDWLAVTFREPVPVVRCRAREDARIVASESSLESDVVTRRVEGRGHIIFMGVRLRDLLSAPADLTPLLRRLFYLPPVADADQPRPAPASMFAQVASAVGFAASGTLYLLAAALFSIGYVAAATFGLWTWLGRRGWRKHSWTAFAVAGGVASVLSVFAVGAVRGIGDRLHQVTVVDLQAGSREACATAYLGLKTGIDKPVDLWLPDNWVAATQPEAGRSSLRPLPVNLDAMESWTRYADPASYRLVPSSAVLEDVRVRATLKRFEGRWAGHVDGTVHGRIFNPAGRIADESYLVNDLGFPLKDCILLVPRLDPDAIENVRANAIDVYSLGEVPPGASRVSVVDLFLDAQGIAPLADNATALQDIRVPTLRDAQSEWGKSVGGSLLSGGDAQFAAGQERNALLLASTVGDFDPTTHPRTMRAVFGLQTWSRDRLRQMDLRSHLLAGRPGHDAQPRIEGTAVLIGFADDPGPLRLFTKTGDRPYRVLEPEPAESWSMYRVRLPMTRSVAAAGPATDAPSARTGEE